MAAENPQIQPEQLMESALPSLDDEWRQWIGLNLMQGAPSEQLAQILSLQGFHKSEIERELNAAQNHPYVQAGRGVYQKLKKRDWVLNCISKLHEMSSYRGLVDTRYKISREEFFEQYYFANKPLVIKGMLDHWPALKLWTPDYLKSQCGDKVVEVQFGRNTDPDYEINQDRYRKIMPFADYVDLIASDAETNDYYITANNTNTNGTALQTLWKDVPLITEYMQTADSYPGFFWYGPKGTITPAHHDLTNNFMAQVRGKKLVRMVPPCHLPRIYNHQHCYSLLDFGMPDYKQFPDFAGVTIIDVILEPGDLFFLPVGYWHYVRGLETSITMTYTNFLHCNDFNSFYSTYGPLL